MLRTTWERVSPPALLTPEAAKGTKYSVKKVGSQRTTSAAGIEISQTHPIHKFPGKFTHQPSLFFLPLLFQILSVFFIYALHLLSPCNVSSNTCQEPHPCSSINSPLFCSTASALPHVLRLGAVSHSSPRLLHINPLKMGFTVHFTSNFTHKEHRGEKHVHSQAR